MAELDIKQGNFTSRAVQIAPQLIEILSQLDNLWLEWNALGYQPGGANAIEDSDFIGDNAHMTAIALNDLLFAYGSLTAAADAGLRATLYRASP